MHRCQDRERKGRSLTGTARGFGSDGSGKLGWRYFGEWQLGMEGLSCRTDGRGQLGGRGRKAGVVTWSTVGEHRVACDARGWRRPARARCSAYGAT
jgi:hypothetical protein